MLALKDFQWRTELIATGAAVGLGLTGMAVWRMIQSSKEKQRKWQKIAAVRQNEANFRTDLKRRLNGSKLDWTPEKGSNYRKITKLPFDELVAKLQSGELTAVEALRSYQYTALAATEKTNCVVHFIRDAEERAANLDSLPEGTPKKPLHGVPVSVKECFIVQGTEATAGFGSFLGKFTNSTTSPVVQFLIDQGCVPFVKTNVPQAMISFDSRNPIYGITRNPHDLSRSPGGSSSGEAAILASSASVLGLGTDIGGSTRIPPAWCGVYAMKPTSQRMISDRGGAEPGSEGTNRVMPHDFGTYSFMARDSESLHTIYRLFYSESTFLKNPELVPLAFRDDMFKSTKPLTIGYYYTLENVVESVPAMKRGVELAKEALERCGHKLVEFTIPNPRQAYLLEMEAVIADGGVDTGLPLTEDVEVSYPNQHLVAATWSNWYRTLFSLWYKSVLGSLAIDCLFAMVPKSTPHEVNITLRKIKDYRKKCLASIYEANIDALLGPAFPCPAVHLDAPRDMVAAVAYTCIFNVLNWPAGVVPVATVEQQDEEKMSTYPELDSAHQVIKNSLSSGTVGLPVGVQLAAKPYAEEVVLRLMAALEKALKR